MNEDNKLEERLDDLSDLVAKLADRIIALENEKVSKNDFDDRITAIEADHEEITRDIDALKEKLDEEEAEIEKDEMEK